MMATERHNAIESFGRVLDAAYQVDRGASFREIEPVGSAGRSR